MSVCCEYCVLSSRGLCDELITRPEESYWLWCVVCDLETSWMRRVCRNGGLLCQKQTNSISQSAIFQKLKDKNCIQYGVVDIVTWLWALWSDVSFPAVTRDMFFSKVIQISPRAHTKSFSKGTSFFFPVVEWQGQEAETFVRNGWSCTSIALYALMS